MLSLSSTNTSILELDHLTFLENPFTQHASVTGVADKGKAVVCTWAVCYWWGLIIILNLGKPFSVNNVRKEGRRPIHVRGFLFT